MEELTWTKAMVRLLGEAIKVARANQQFIGDGNDYCITIAQLERLIFQFSPVTPANDAPTLKSPVEQP